ncbi:hypothetical protein HF521_006609 [Silurus meridionalis]|uniref:Uncharacterized protein n=1 Tax=Silurus meridionalis TaxID=175797 RepID=A0A8T0ARP5_SILME|nr:hypothetical protein HF521_006609 [Silurus meridionalis]
MVDKVNRSDFTERNYGTTTNGFCPEFLEADDRSGTEINQNPGCRFVPGGHSRSRSLKEVSLSSGAHDPGVTDPCKPVGSSDHLGKRA